MKSSLKIMGLCAGLSVATGLAMLPASVVFAEALPEPLEINAELFPDEAFRKEVLAVWDENHDGKLSADESKAKKSLDFSGADVLPEDLTGIHYLPGLQELTLEGSKLSSLDLSGNLELKALNLSRNNLSELDLSQQTQLKKLNLAMNYVRKLDLSNLMELEELGFAHNGAEALLLPQGGKLQKVYAFENRLKELNTANLPELQVLELSSNRLTALNLAGSPKLTVLGLNYNSFVNLDVKNKINSCPNRELNNDSEDQWEDQCQFYAEPQVVVVRKGNSRDDLSFVNVPGFDKERFHMGEGISVNDEGLSLRGMHQKSPRYEDCVSAAERFFGMKRDAMGAEFMCSLSAYDNGKFAPMGANGSRPLTDLIFVNDIDGKSQTFSSRLRLGMIVKVVLIMVAVMAVVSLICFAISRCFAKRAVGDKEKAPAKKASATKATKAKKTSKK